MIVQPNVDQPLHKPALSVPRGRLGVVLIATSLAMASTGVGIEPVAAAASRPDPSYSMSPVVDRPAPVFWDQQEHQRVGAAAYRYELNDPSRALTLSTWYYLAFIPNGDRIR